MTFRLFITMLFSYNYLFAANAVFSEGKVHFVVSASAPPQFSLTGQSAELLYKYLQVKERPDPYYGGQNIMMKSGNGMNCWNKQKYGYECQFMLDRGGIVKPLSALR